MSPKKIALALAVISLFAVSTSGCMTFMYPYTPTVVDVGKGKVIKKGGFPITFGGVKVVNGTSYSVNFVQSGKWGDEYYALDVPPGGTFFFYWDAEQYPSMAITARVCGTEQTVSQVFSGGASYGSYTPRPQIWTVYVDGEGNLRAHSQ